MKRIALTVLLLVTANANAQFINPTPQQHQQWQQQQAFQQQQQLNQIQQNQEMQQNHSYIQQSQPSTRPYVMSRPDIGGTIQRGLNLYKQGE